MIEISAEIMQFLGEILIIRKLFNKFDTIINLQSNSKFSKLFRASQKQLRIEF
jgi:hypothetical protein